MVLFLIVVFNFVKCFLAFFLPLKILFARKFWFFIKNNEKSKTYKTVLKYHQATH